jgi:hypothetical protein
MAEADLIAQIPALIEKGGLPAMVGGALLALFWKFGRNKGDDPETKMAAALNALTAEVGKMRLEMTDRFARIESDVKHLEGRK